MSAVARIGIDNAPGEFRAVAFDEAGRAVRAFVQRWGGESEAVRAGDIVSGRLRETMTSTVRTFDHNDGGGFFELDSGEMCFVRGPFPEQITQGAERLLLIASAARTGKLARARFAPADAPEPVPAFERWLASIPSIVEDVERVESAEIADDIDQVFETILTDVKPLQAGGNIAIERTRALTAIDVDTAGRVLKGAPMQRARDMNTDAVAEAARQLALGEIGGLVVIDCIAPIQKESRPRLAKAVEKTFRQASDRRITCLLPSAFGLLEVKLDWRERPIADVLTNGSGTLTGESELLGLLREVRREAASDRSGFYSLALSQAARAAYIGRKQQCDELLRSHFSGRVAISGETSERSKVSRQ